MMNGRKILAQELRRLHEEIVSSDAPDDCFFDMSKIVKDWIKTLQNYPRRKRHIADNINEEIQSDGERYHYGDLLYFSPLAGISNPIAPPMKISKKDNTTLTAAVTFTKTFEGGPGFVHGGYIAAAFDELLGLTQSLSGMAGMTGILKVRYKNPCPINTQLSMEGRLKEVEGKKIVAVGRIYNGEKILADSEAIFIIIDKEKFQKKLKDL